MPLIADVQNIAAYHAPFTVHEEEKLQQHGNIFDVGYVELSKLQIGPATYPLRNTLHGNYFRSTKQLHFDGASPTFVGNGVSSADALADFSLTVHQCFQRLLHTRPFEMNSSDMSQWEILNQMIDVTLYRNTSPVPVRQFGEVLYEKHSYPKAIRWDNGFKETIELSQVESDDFVSYVPGQPVEAIVVRDALSRKLLRISYICRSKSLRTSQEIAESGLPDRIGTSSDLPDADWD